VNPPSGAVDSLSFRLTTASLSLRGESKIPVRHRARAFELLAVM
jgi:hypothetical protein